MKTSLSIAAAVVLCGLSLAAPQKVDIQVTVLELKNGKELGAATIKSYDHETGNVIVMANRTISSIQLELLPDELAAKILKIVPPEAKALQRDTQIARESEKRAAQAKVETDVRKRAAQQAAERAERSGEAQMDLAAQREQQKLERVKATARSRASQYFRYEFNLGTSVYVFGTDLDFEEPEAVSGWPDRYRVRGRAGIRYYVNKGSSLNTTSRDFEIVLQGDAKGNLKTVEIECN